MKSAGILVDTYTWIEILKNSIWGNRALAIIEQSPPAYISVLTLYELQYRLEELYGHETASTRIRTILSYTETIPVDEQIASLAGLIKFEQKRKKSKMGAVDCMILATARLHNLKVLTGDRHFSGTVDSMLI
ncbi:MAG: PIN domain-containing protein [Methanoregula sp.]|nr:PIN domain-containing protein [Methanoregula sp.]